MEPLTIRIRAETKESLDEEADEYDVSVSEYVRELIRKGARIRRTGRTVGRSRG